MAKNTTKASERRRTAGSLERSVRGRFRWQRCTECGHEGTALAVLHLQDCLPCPVCQRTTRREYADRKPSNVELSDRRDNL